MFINVFHEIEILLLVIIVGLVGIGMRVCDALIELKEINIRLAQSAEWSRYLAEKHEINQEEDER